jgi:hypothetical protein
MERVDVTDIQIWLSDFRMSENEKCQQFIQMVGFGIQEPQTPLNLGVLQPGLETVLIYVYIVANI